MNPFIHIFGFSLPVYGLLMMTGFGVGGLVAVLLAKIKKWTPAADVFYVALMALVGGLVGAVSLRPIMRFFEVLFLWRWNEFDTIMDFINFVVGEIVFYGGFIGGLIAILLFCRAFKIKLLPLFDIIAPALPLGHAIGRIGCFFGGCCFGIELPEGHRLAIIYPEASLSAPAGVPLLAMPLIEAGFLVLLFIVMATVLLLSKKPGRVAPIYLLAYPVGRFILEFFRGDLQRGHLWWMSTSQIISIIIFAFGVVYLVRANFWKKEAQ